MSGNLYQYINVLGKAADASWTRMEAINHNIANVSTPNYKRKDVAFEALLSKELGEHESIATQVEHVDVNRLKASVYTDTSELSYRMDGNNVDIDVEAANQAETQIKYNALIDSITAEFSRIRAVLNK